MEKTLNAGIKYELDSTCWSQRLYYGCIRNRRNPLQCRKYLQPG